jgi:hypothetical protein
LKQPLPARLMKTRIASRNGRGNALRTAALVTSLILAVSRFAGPVRAATLYWDIDGSIAGNNASTGANLGGSGIWSTANANWWNTSLVTPQVWTDGSDAVFWGTAGAVAASSISANSLLFKTNGYSVNSGTLTMTGAASFTVDSGLTATVSSTIAGSSTMWKLGLGTLILSNVNNTNTATNTSGGWRIEGGGTLRIMGDGSLGAPLPDTARNTVTDIQLNQSTIQAGASFELSQNRRTKINTNATTNLGDAIIDVDANVLTWYGSLQGGPGSLRVTSKGGNGGMLILGTDKIASINPFGSVLPAGTGQSYGSRPGRRSDVRPGHANLAASLAAKPELAAQFSRSDSKAEAKSDPSPAATRFIAISSSARAAAVSMSAHGFKPSRAAPSLAPAH